MNNPTQAEQADIAVAAAVDPLHDTPAVKAIGWASELADQPQLISISAAVCVAGLVFGEARLARAGARMLAAELLATKLKSFVKHRVDRARPSVVAQGGRYTAKLGDDETHEMTSFPSGHTAGAVAVARAFARDYPEHRAGSYGLALATGAIQLPRRKHYVTDVVAGAVLGWAAEQAIQTLVAAVARPRRPGP
jgi:membrane-associated phospholipid phosphatase